MTRLPLWYLSMIRNLTSPSTLSVRLTISQCRVKVKNLYRGRTHVTMTHLQKIFDIFLGHLFSKRSHFPASDATGQKSPRNVMILLQSLSLDENVWQTSQKLSQASHKLSQDFSTCAQIFHNVSLPINIVPASLLSSQRSYGGNHISPHTSLTRNLVYPLNQRRQTKAPERPKSVRPRFHCCTLT